MIVVASANGRIGIHDAMRVLRDGGTAVDAVIAGIKPVEANPDDHSVGFSGLPNLLGEVELDASIMDGKRLRTGAVGALRDYQDAIELSRRVMEDLPHVLIVGDGVRRLAADSGMKQVDLLDEAARALWRRRLDAVDGKSNYTQRVRELVREIAVDPELTEPPHGTVNVIAMDGSGDIACGVSTSGWAWKYPGRLGDSPIIGAGNYADNRWGAAACTGRGEMAQRCCTAHSVVTFMRFGMSLDEAIRQAMLDLLALDDPYASEVNLIAIDKFGRPAAASTAAGKTFIYMTTAMSKYAEEERAFVRPA